jgi:phosphoribosyl 1,2-cyclic phosphodiesterase
MKVKIWGNRGSISVPGKDTVRYGGNTSCYEVRSESGQLIILDAGTGIRNLGNTLLGQGAIEATLLFSHTHYDHVIGYPFFTPFYIPGNKFNMYGPVHFEKSFKQVMYDLLDYSFFPVRMDEFGSELNFHDLKEESIQIGDFKIETMYSNHPVTTLAYKITCDDKIVVYTGDFEQWSNYLEGDPDASEDEIEEVDIVVEEQLNRWKNFFQGADLILHDAQYTPEEYPKFKGWGHTSMDTAIDTCVETNVKKLLLTHHDPNRTDDQLDDLLIRWKDYTKTKNSDMEVEFSIEEEIYQL